MKLKLIRHLWGVDQPWEVSFPKSRSDGFVGVETSVVPAAQERRFGALRKEHGLEYVAMAFTNGANVAEHLRSFREQVERAVDQGAMQITCQSGSDAWALSEMEQFYREAIQIERQVKIPVAHETHRGRALFNPWVTRDVLERVEGLKLCCDFSHWVCVAERLLDDCAPIIELAASRCIHIHARVGYEEGPQVPDPSAPEYQRHVEAHERWWDLVWKSQQARGFAHSTLTPEFGPPGYLHTLPHTNVPVADLDRVCKYMADRLAARFARAS